MINNIIVIVIHNYGVILKCLYALDRIGVQIVNEWSVAGTMEVREAWRCSLSS